MLRVLGALVCVLVALGCADESQSQDEPLEDPNCHYDCGGVATCEGGLINLPRAAPIACEAWTGSCGSGQFDCESGCRADGVRESFAQTMDVAIADLCEEHRPKQVDDLCATEADCQPQVAVRNDDGTVSNTYLECDATLGRCVARAPTVIKDFFATCDLHPIRKPRHSVLETSLCSGGVCAYSANDTDACIHQACTARCDSDGDCPQGTICLGDATVFRGLCMPYLGSPDRIDLSEWTCLP